VRERKTFEPYYARGKIMIARAILENKLSLSESVAEKFFYCLLCGNCKEHCYQELDTVEIFKAVRTQLVKEGYAPAAVNELINQLERYHNVFSASQEQRLSQIESIQKIADNHKVDLKNLPKKIPETLYFIGCVSSYRLPNVAVSTIKILEKQGIDFIVLGGDEWCCGDPLFLAGGSDLAREVAERNVAVFKKLGIKRILTSCAGCYRTFVEEYPKIFGKSLQDMGIEVLHTVQLLAKLEEEGKLKFKKGLKGKITYHDPCEIGRSLGVYDEPRRVLQSIPDIDFVELPRNRENAWCCGGGGVMKVTHPDMALDIVNDKLEEANEVDADIIVSCCPTCEWHIDDGVKTTGNAFRVLDLTELVAEVME